MNDATWILLAVVSVWVPFSVIWRSVAANIDRGQFEYRVTDETGTLIARGTATRRADALERAVTTAKNLGAETVEEWKDDKESDDD